MKTKLELWRNKQPRIWVIEMAVETSRGRRWEPCAGCAISYRDAKHELDWWRGNGDAVRIARYARVAQ